MKSSLHLRSLTIVGWLVLTIGLTSGCSENETPAIEQAWSDFYAAHAAKDSQKAVGLVSQSTVDFYERLRRVALEADEAEVKGMRFAEKFMVLQMRARMTPAYIRNLTGQQVFMVSVRDAWDAKSYSTVPELTNIRVDGETASATMIVRGKEAPFDYQFVKEGGVWRHDLTAMMDMLSDMMAQAMRTKPAHVELDMDDLLLMTLRMQTGKDVPDDIWMKPKE